MQGICVALASPDDSPKAVAFELLLGVPNLLFVVFLAWHVRRCLETLKQQKSTIMTTYYAFLWAVCILSLFRTVVQVSQTRAHGTLGWNILWLFTRLCMIMLEASVVVFLLHGYTSSSSTALLRSLAISATLAAADLLAKLLFIFQLHVPLYSYWDDPAAGPAGDMAWSKWGFWLAHSLLFTLVYTVLLLLPLTQWRDLLPAKDTFHRYVRALFVVNLLSSLGALCIGLHWGGGYCVYGIANAAYYALYPPLLYVTFLASFFKTDDFELDSYYYSEMSEAGYVNMDDDMFLVP